MALDPELIELMTQTVRIYRSLGHNEYGQTSYEAEPYLVKCHIDSRAHQVSAGTNEMRLSTGKAYLAEILPWFHAGDNASVPDPAYDDGWRPVDVIGVQTRYDEAGPHHQEMIFGELT